MELNQGEAGDPAASVNDAELDARLTGMEQRLGDAMEGRMQAMMAQVMSQLPSLMRGALDVGGVQQEEESGGDVGASTGASGDADAPNSNQGSAATGTVGGGGYGGGYGPQGEAATTGSGVGGGFASGGVAGEGLFTGGGGISKFTTSHVNPPLLKKGAEQYPGWRQDMIVQAGILDVGDVFSGGGVLPDVTKSQVDLLGQGFSHAALRKTYLAWNFLSAALTTETDKAILRRCTNPREALRQLDAAYLPETQGAQQQLFREFQQYQTPRKENPVASLNKLVGMANMMQKGGGAMVTKKWVAINQRHAHMKPTLGPVQKQAAHQTSCATVQHSAPRVLLLPQPPSANTSPLRCRKGNARAVSFVRAQDGYMYYELETERRKTRAAPADLGQVSKTTQQGWGHQSVPPASQQT